VDVTMESMTKFWIDKIIEERLVKISELTSEELMTLANTISDELLRRMKEDIWTPKGGMVT
jgi:hypothetical protein